MHTHRHTHTSTHTCNTHVHTQAHAHMCVCWCVFHMRACVCARVCVCVACVRVLHVYYMRVCVCAPGPLLGLHCALFFGLVSPTVNSAGRSSAHFYAMWPSGLPCQKITCESGAGRLEGEAHSGRRDWLRVSCRLRFASTELQQKRDH